MIHNLACIKFEKPKKTLLLNQDYIWYNEPADDRRLQVFVCLRFTDKLYITKIILNNEVII